MSCALPHADAECPKKKKKRKNATHKEDEKLQPGTNAGESPSKGKDRLC
jgi:hypothetical protein